MDYLRVIPCLDVKNGRLVKGIDRQMKEYLADRKIPVRL